MIINIANKLPGLKLLTLTVVSGFIKVYVAIASTSTSQSIDALATCSLTPS